MAYDITSKEVLDGFSISVSERDVAGYIEIVSQADECMTRNSVPDVIGQRLKVLAVRHMASLVGIDGSGGQVVSQRAQSGASRTFKEADADQGTHYGGLLRQLDSWGCVLGLIENNANFTLRSIGRRPERASTY